MFNEDFELESRKLEFGVTEEVFVIDNVETPDGAIVLTGNVELPF